MKHFKICLHGCFLLIFSGISLAGENGLFSDFAPLEYHGYIEARSGWRTRNDKYEKDMSLNETRMQLEAFTYNSWADFKFKGDVYAGLVEEQAEFDLREGYIFTRPFRFMDMKVGRQVLTWGTGDMLFINDLFPKDWQSFFIGRDVEYLKAPSDAAKISLFSDLANIDIVYTPQFDSDEFIRGERLSYWNSTMSSLAGENAVKHTNKPDRWFRDDEIAVRIYRNINNYELALYAYHGYWKSPGGQTPSASQVIFPDLDVYGTSIRGAVGKGIANLEFGYYQSKNDESGTDGNINNSQMRFLAGYTQEIARDFTAGVQYYLEHMTDYSKHQDSSPSGLDKDRNRHLTTLRLTKLLMNQNLTLSLFTYYSPSDRDVYMRPKINYKATDNLMLEAGANIFFGDYPDTFFGQFKNNTNIYTAVRYSF
jgi:hypothetical protein